MQCYTRAEHAIMEGNATGLGLEPWLDSNGLSKDQTGGSSQRKVCGAGWAHAGGVGRWHFPMTMAKRKSILWKNIPDRREAIQAGLCRSQTC